MNQKEAVFKAITRVRGETEFDGQVSLSREEREKVSQNLFSEFKAGNVTFAGEIPEDKKLTGYISGLISNWLRKDNRLNGGIAYVPRNPGSRTGNGDESLKAMRALMGATTDAKARAEIQQEIDRRVSELKPKKVINKDALPESLRKYAVQH